MNRFHVGVRGIGPARVVSFTVSGRQLTLSTEQALELACWIVALTDPREERFDEIIRQIEDA